MHDQMVMPSYVVLTDFFETHNYNISTAMWYNSDRRYTKHEY